MAEDQQRKRPGIGEGLRAGIGVLTAVKQAVEETFQEAVDRGDLAPDKAKDAVSAVFQRAQDAIGDVRERMDVVPRREFDELRAAVAELSRRLAALEGRPPVPSDHLLPPT
ncbi:MAG TPA: hypothetical protein VFE05_21725 [Longimicrobiaceae bacterium]|jgi:polyhydroxyalkanoate synthesis regulator phasin|nr:hypothetical protein [Longimicrobiaceae bacterium]